MPNLIPDSDGVRKFYTADITVSFSIVTQHGSPAAQMTEEENLANLVEAFKQELGHSPLAMFSDDFTVDAKASVVVFPGA